MGYFQIELKLINQRLDWSHVRIPRSADKYFRLGTTYIEPLLFVSPKLFGSKLSASGMFVIVTVNLRMAFEADWNCVVYAVRTTISLGNDVVGLDFHTTETVADTTSTMAGY